MNEESGLISAVGAMGSMSDYVSTQDHSPAPQTAVNAPAAVASVSSAPARPSAQDVQDALKQINDHLASVDRVLSLKVDPASGYTIAQISNSQTGQVLQQMPTENHIQLERLLARWARGGNVLMDEQA
jgi:uncharacterized FlaG/YvyC family protein